MAGKNAHESAEQLLLNESERETHAGTVKALLVS